PLVLVVAPEFDATRDLSDDRVILGPTCLEQLGNTRKTAGDVARLGALERDTRKNVAGFDLRARIDRQNRVDRQEVAGIAAARELMDLPFSVLDSDGGLEACCPLVAAPVDDDAVGDTG